MPRSGEEANVSRRSVLKAMAAAGLIPAGAYKVQARSNREQGESSNRFENVVPTPIETNTRPTEYTITENSAIAVRSDDARDIAEYLAGLLRPATGYELPIVEGPLQGRAGGIELRLAGAPKKAGEEGYRLNVTPRSVRIRANQPAGLFNGVQTLRQLLPDKIESDTQQSSPWTVPGGQIIDYPELPIRGSIEGFYGPPWSHEDRLRQLEFYGEYKMNSYIYAPKDDPYHREKWRQPYPSDDLNKLKKLVKTARRNYVEFTFALSPGQSICYSSDDDFQALIDKFESMYDIGIRSFYIAFDDINYTDWECEQDPERFGTGGVGAGKAQAHLLNKVKKQFVEAHEDVEPLQMVPTEYHSVSESSYKEALREELDSDVLVQWTGTAVVAEEITQDQAEAAHSVFGHDIFVWDNYPVNDYARDRLFLGPLTGRDPELDDHGLVGLTSNPMNEAEASKISLITASDYMWNSSAYKPEQTWEQALRKFGDNAYEPLRTFAENTRSTPLNGSLSESPELSKLTKEFWTAFEAGDFTSEAKALKQEFTAIKQAPSKLRKQVNNDAFLDEVEPWFEKAKTTGTAGKLAVRMLTAQRSGDGATTWKLRQKFQNAVDQSKDNPKQYAPGVAKDFFNSTIDSNNKWLGTGARTDPLTAIGSYGDHTPQRMIDDNVDTFYWSNSAPNPGDAFGVDLGKVFSITNIDIKMANSSSQKDYVHHGTLEVSTNNKEWTTLGEFSDQSEISITPSHKMKARYVRLRATKSQSSWVIIRDFSVTSPDRVQLEASGNPPAAENSSFYSAIDRQPKTQYTATRPPHQGEAFEVAFSSSKTLEQITILQDNTKPVDGTVEIQSDGKWMEIGQLNGGYTTIATDSVKTDRIRILWADGTIAPVLYEVIPQFENEEDDDEDQIYDSLAAAFNADGISANDDATTGNFDDGFSYPAAELADTGLSPGATVTQDEVSFTWPNVAPETNDPNEVVTNGQTIALSGQSDTLGFLGAAATSDPPASAIGTVHYTDESSESFTLSFNDWYINETLEGNTKVATVPWTAPSNTSLDPNHNVSIYYTSISIDSGKIVKAVTLPSNDHLHIFAMALGKTTTPLSPIGDSQNAPTDPDGDGLYEDIDGDGKVTDADGAVFEEHIDDPEMQDNVEAFDFNDNGRLDFDDIVEWRKKKDDM